MVMTRTLTVGSKFQTNRKPWPKPLVGSGGGVVTRPAPLRLKAKGFSVTPTSTKGSIK